MNIQRYLERQSKKIDDALLSFLPREKNHPKFLSQAMRYAVLSGGKRVRPVLALAACEAVGGKAGDVLAAACALELIHSYSLVHDDLPCMDNDSMRRGKPSCHVKYGEVTALLAGDALLTLAFKILSLSGGKNSHNRLQLQALQWIAEHVGHQGMVGGQQLDMELRQKEMDLPSMEYINTHKTGFLIAISVKTGAYLGGGSPKQVEALYRYGKTIGLLFQVVDDIMDRQGYAQVIGPRDAQQQASRLLSKAKAELRVLGKKGRTLGEMADFIATRKN